jgi:hypothetical protein
MIGALDEAEAVVVVGPDDAVSKTQNNLSCDFTPCYLRTARSGLNWVETKACLVKGFGFC